MIGVKMRSEHLRGLLGLVVLAVGLRVAWGLVALPDSLFSLGVGGGH